MKPTSFKETNICLSPGNNPNTDQMPVCIAENDEIPGQVFLLSKHKLSQEELEEVNKTGVIYISLMSRVHPPIFAFVHNPFQVYGYKPLEINDK